MERLFGTDGIRARVGEFPLTQDFVTKLGETIGYILSKKNSNPTLLIGKDTRFSGDDLESFLIEGASKYPVNIYRLSTIPTAALSHFTKKFNTDLGVMISASHNLSDDNGIKLFASDGLKITEEKEKEIEKIILQEVDNEDLKDLQSKEASVIDNNHEQLIREYIDFAKGTVKDIKLKGFRIVIDCAHGAVYNVADKVLEELGAEVITLNNRPDGRNINLGCGSQHPEVVARSVLKNNAHIGFSFDGDGDRAILADEKGQILDGDYILAMIGLDLLEKKRLNKNALVATIMSNMGLDKALEKYSIRVLRTKVGDKYVVQKMIEEKLNFGGEQSGHIVFFDYSTTGDGIITALQVLRLMKEKDKYLSELSGYMEKFPQVLLNVKVKEKKNFSQIPKLLTIKDRHEKELNNSGRIILRYSGTEPLFRIMVEGKNLSMIQKISQELANTIKEDIGVD